MTPGRRVAIIGDGQMGRALESVADEAGWVVAACLGRGDVRADAGGVDEVLRSVDIAFEFTTPDAAVGNIERCVTAGCPVVVGTTGWLDALPALSRRVEAQGGSLLWAANFSVGVAILSRLVDLAGALLAEAAPFDVRLRETHHTRKRDAPSGTALALAERLERRVGGPIPIDSLREGDVVGTHVVEIEGRYERLALTHEATDRRVFAHGALVAADWLIGRTGVYTLDDVLDLGEEEG